MAAKDAESVSGLTATAEDVRAAYRLVLGREPDSAGLKNYLELIDRRPTPTRRLLESFLNSSEFLAQSAGTKVDLGGVCVMVDAFEPEFGATIARDARWEPHIASTIKAHLAPGLVFVDVGANVGVMSFTAAQAVGPRGRVISFEPNERNAELFLRGVFENGFQRFVRLHRLALSDRADLFALDGGSNAFLVRPERNAALVQSVPGDEMLAAEAAIHFIKIDIEGHEPFALKGLTRTLRRHRPIVLCEFNPRCLKDHIGMAPEEFAELLFTFTDELRVIEHDGRTSRIAAAKALTDMWSRRDEEAVDSGFLPSGMVHFDLLFRAK